jgi:hypothetical protein
MSDLDGPVAAILAATPVDRYGQIITGYSLGDGESRGDPTPVAARQAAAAAARAFADMLSCEVSIDQLHRWADKIEAGVGGTVAG